MQIQTSRFGVVEVPDKDILTFPEGIFGFNTLRQFVLLDDPNDEIFAWLQSCEEPGLAFPILEPEIFAANYKVNLSRYDYEALQMNDMKRARIFNIVTIPEDATQMTANLKAPIVLNIEKRYGKQVVLQENDYQIKFPIFNELQKRVVQNPLVNFKNQTLQAGPAVKLGAPQPKGAGRQVEI